MIHALMNLEHEFDVLVVDDGSPDGTAAIVKSMMEEFPGRVHIIERSGKLGLGTAYIAGFKWALAQGYEYIFGLTVRIDLMYRKIWYYRAKRC